MNFQVFRFSGFQRFALLLSLGWLWHHLINHLRIEWSLNEQYAYGWAVPFLCAYLLWLRLHPPPFALPASRLPPRTWRFPLPALLFALLAFAYLPTRLIEEANPEWRLVSWALALITLGITLCVLRLALPAWRSAQIVFPLCYFLVAVPWPTIIEGPLIQLLTRANIAVTIELLNFIGVPAIQHGNVIEVATGVVGVDEACSGIRSFQATLMISLFLGEYYRLFVLRRLALCLSGFALSFIFNVGRAGLLTWVAARDGVPAISKWHDPAGVIILLGCFTGLWAIGVWLKRGNAQVGRATPLRAESDSVGRVTPCAPPSPPRGEGVRRTDEVSSDLRPLISDLAAPGGASVPASHRPTSPPSAHRAPPSALSASRLTLALAAWLALVEIGVETWYRAHESRAPSPVVWTVNWPTNNPTLKTVPISEVTRRMLRYDECENLQWREATHAWQGIYIRWQPGRTAVHLAKSHTPEICLTAAGHRLLSTSDLQWLTVRGLRMPFRIYSVGSPAGLLYVFYCLWEDRAQDRNFDSVSLKYGVRLAPVLAGHRQGGQRSLEIVLQGAADEASAIAALQAFLESYLHVTSSHQ